MELAKQTMSSTTLAGNLELGQVIELSDGLHINNGTYLQPLHGRNLAHSLQTVSGKFIWPLDPRPDEIDEISIARGLSTECRFGNQSPYPLPVAWHCVALSHVVPSEYAQAALLHDASEAYLKDIPRPLRRQEPFKGAYEVVEERLLRVCFEKFGVDYDLMDNEQFLFYDVKMSWCEMTVWSKTHPVFEAKMNGLFANNPKAIEHSKDQEYIEWVERCPQDNVWQQAENAWLERFDELF